jgi:hypothetical protein
MMTIWLISLIALWVNPIICFVISRQTKSKPDQRKKFFLFAVWTISIIAFGLLTKISTASIEADWFILAIFHFAVCVLLWIGLYQKNKIISVLSVLVMIFVFGVGYLLSTIGILGLGFITGEYEPSKDIRINNSTVYREYGLGNATTSWGGTKVCLFTNFYWFPFFEREFFSKQYIGGSNIDKNENFITPENSYVNNSPTFYGNGLEIKYDTVKQEIILFNDHSQDTLHLNRPR